MSQAPDIHEMGARETTRGERMRQGLRNLSERIAKAGPTDLAGMCKRWGVRAPATFEDVEPERIELADLEVDDQDSLLELACAYPEATTLRELADLPMAELFELGEFIALGDDVDPEALPEGEIGRPGTKVSAGILRMDPSWRLTPFITRGRNSDSGVYDEHYREPLVYKAVQSIREILVSGVWEVHVPEDIDDARREEVTEAAAQVWSALRSTRDGWEHYLEHAASCVHMGFAPFEVVWGEVFGRSMPVRLGFREQSTVRSWLFDEHYRELSGAAFQVGGDASVSYVLPATGKRTTDHRMVVATLGGRGLNVEGVPPTRTIDSLISKKRLLLTIQAACAERFGAPILAAMLDERIAGHLAALGDLKPDQAKWEEFFDVLEELLALDTPTLSFPVGLRAEYIGPGGEMPDFQTQLEYIDSQIMLAFSAQGALLGQQSVHGSYALSQTADNDFLRSAPYYARVVARPINSLMRLILRNEYGLRLGAYPEVRWRMGGAQDTGRWLADLGQLATMRAQLSSSATVAALERLGLPPDTFEVEEGDEGVPVIEGEDASKSALNGAQIASLVDIATRVKIGELALDVAANIISRSFLMPVEEALELLGGDQAPAPSPEPSEPTSLAEVADLDPDLAALERVMDRVEDALAAELATVQRRMRTAWREKVRDGGDAGELVAAREAIRAEFGPELLAAVIAAGKGAAEDAAALYMGALGVEGARYTLDVDGEVELLAVDVADEALGRMVGVMSQGEVERAGGARKRSVDVLAASTLALIASRIVSTSVNRARDRVAQGLVEEASSRGARIGRVMATRSAVLDGNTCSECERLDGKTAVVGSASYRDLTPPHGCLGRERCRCVWIYSLPVDALRAAGVLGEAVDAERDALKTVREP